MLSGDTHAHTPSRMQRQAWCTIPWLLSTVLPTPLVAGARAWQVQSPYCNSSLYNMVLSSTLEFTCSPCAQGLYSLFAGSSDGTPGQAVNPQCLPCPQGAVCTGGVATAAPG
jgi:hypothetical protein